MGTQVGAVFLRQKAHGSPSFKNVAQTMHTVLIIICVVVMAEYLFVLAVLDR